MIKFLKDKKNWVIVLLSILFVIKAFQEDVRFVFWVLGGVFFCFLLDLFISNLFFNKYLLPNSAIISGFILSGIIDYHQGWQVLIIFSFLAIVSKHIFKFNQKHIFNPANFGLFIAGLFKIPLTWNIESNVYLIVIFGLYFAYAYRKFAHILGFLLFFISLFGFSGINPFGIISWFFVFIMLIEPKTSGYGFRRGFLFGSIAGIATFLTFKYLAGYGPFVSALFIANLFNPLLERITTAHAR